MDSSRCKSRVDRCSQHYLLYEYLDANWQLKGEYVNKKAAREAAQSNTSFRIVETIVRKRIVVDYTPRKLFDEPIS